MINQVYRLVSPRQFEITYKDHSINKNDVVIRPTYLSICVADQRYYTGKRGEEAMAKKLPMALIHEGIGEIVFDPKGEHKIGDRVVMIPNIPIENDNVISENYLRSSKFRSSGSDGFMQDYVFLQKDRFIVLPKHIDEHVAAFTELISVAMHAITRFDVKTHPRRNTFAVWGDGNLGYILALILKKQFKDSKIIVVGKTHYKLANFSFADETYTIDKLPSELIFDHAFECVGGIGSQSAINQMIDYINPEGTLSILGVSEYPIEMNTRMILEKGLIVIGSSRSGYDDFKKTVDFLSEHEDVIDYLKILIGSVNEVKSIEDIVDTFEQNLSISWGKSIIKWSI